MALWSLGAKQFWFRYEFTVLRGEIHSHGLAKLKSDPNLCELSRVSMNGFKAKSF